MKRNELYHLQEQMLQKFTQHYRNRILALDYAQVRILTFEVPLIAEAFMDNFLVEKGEKHYHIQKTSNAERIFYELDATNNCNRDLIQHDLWDMDFPHTVYIENWDEEWKRRDFRYLNGEYCVHDTSSFYEFIDVQEVAKTFEDFRFNELKTIVDGRLAKTMTFDFTEEDISRVKPLVLKAICMR
ncbi:hypothetical protein ACI49N_003130 [Acinetobacter baumannii]|uniref:hypothetical protein n=1 Tax=Acinetobacter sp. TaxID=472 RepID=UPI0012C27A32|nr:hypothetical protein [Acinetobacter sp.]EKV7389863.1 hypothetical protein [Acinetobacter baumannii]EKW3202917.1 hypothetical protein [Acinetobacter baumannii]EKX0107495.1 hypothetical protein [Acinetobacter baumannii]ELB5354695.1 hypothetical protein [Acinetobacter baumannii]MPS62138.1 hypothetical protein [Acinetobacter sp.]